MTAALSKLNQALYAAERLLDEHGTFEVTAPDEEQILHSPDAAGVVAPVTLLCVVQLLHEVRTALGVTDAP